MKTAIKFLIIVSVCLPMTLSAQTWTGNLISLTTNLDVGINTNTPTQALDVNGNIQLPDANNELRGSIYFGGQTHDGEIGMRLFGGNANNLYPGGFIDVVTDNPFEGLRFRVDQGIAATERMRITANGRVGIGTTAPAQALHVKGKVRSSFTGNLSEYVEIYHGGGHGFINTVGDGNLDFRHDNSTKMSLTSAGRLGIGASSPTQKLDVNGNARIRGLSAGVVVSDASGNLSVQSSASSDLDWTQDANGVYNLTDEIGIGQVGYSGIPLTVAKDDVDGMVAIFKNSENRRIFFSNQKVVNAAANPICEIGDAGIHWSDALNSGAKNQASALVIAPHGLNAAGMRLHADGKVQIGRVSTPGDYKLYVDDGILTEKVKVATVNSAEWADYVFDEDYDLNSAEEVETFIKENKHLPNVPSAKEVSENGVDMVEMDATLLRQIEELWLHVIELKKENEALKDEVKTISNK